MLTKLKGFAFKEAVEYGASWAGVTPEKVEKLPLQAPHKREDKQASFVRES
jgi:hypothetical protein